MRFAVAQGVRPQGQQSGDKRERPYCVSLLVGIRTVAQGKDVRSSGTIRRCRSTLDREDNASMAGPAGAVDEAHPQCGGKDHYPGARLPIINHGGGMEAQGKCRWTVHRVKKGMGPMMAVLMTVSGCGGGQCGRGDADTAANQFAAVGSAGAGHASGGSHAATQYADHGGALR